MKIKNVLIVHPDLKERELVTEFATVYIKNIVIKEADNEEDAHLYISQQQFDLILTSIKLEGMEKLTFFGTAIHYLIPDDSLEQMDLVTKIKPKYYQIIPKSRDDFHKKKYQVKVFDSGRTSERYRIPNAKADIIINHQRYKAEILNIGEGGFLCELVTDGDLKDIKSSSVQQIKFPGRIFSKKLTDISCQFLEIRQINSQHKKDRYLLVYTFSDFEPKQLIELQTLISIASNRTRISVQWKKDHLSVGLNGVISQFYWYHLTRIFVACVLLITAIVVLVDFCLVPNANLVWSNGVILKKIADSTVWGQTTENSFSPGEWVKISSSSEAKTSSRPLDTHAVFRFCNNEMVFLSNNGSLHWENENKETIRYDVTGSAHFVYQGDDSGKIKETSINGFTFYGSAYHIFYLEMNKQSRLYVISGDITISPKQEKFLSIDQALKPGKKGLLLSENHMVAYSDQMITINLNNGDYKQYLHRTYLPGFLKDGQFEQVGVGILKQGKYYLDRLGKRYEVYNERLPIMLYDKLTTDDQGILRIEFSTNDIVRLYPSTSFDIKEFETESTVRLIPLSANTQAIDADKKLQLFQFKGRLRANVNPKKKMRRFTLRTTQAIIGVKGTDFEALDTGSKSEVLTVSGVVGLSDLDETQSVDVKKGMMSYTVVGKSPVEPFPIPKERLMDLLADSLDTDASLALSPFNRTDPNQIILAKGEQVSLFWNTGLQSANLIVEGKNYTLKVKKGSPELPVNHASFEELSPGKYVTKLTIWDVKNRTTTTTLQLTLKPNVNIRADRLTFDGKIQFETGKAVIKKESFGLLQEIINHIKSNQKITSVLIEGHTDAQGDSEYNLDLSEKRASAVKQYLFENGIPQTMIIAKGLGESKPIASNSTTIGREKNRRVEFIIQQSK